MRRFAFLVSYLGTRYCGWQPQRHKDGERLSVQSVLEQAIHKMTSERRVVVASGRTDAGVHALAQVAHFDLESDRWSPEILLNGLNASLPVDIRLLHIQEVAKDFQAQRSAEKKRYIYLIQLGRSALPYFLKTTWWIPRPLNVEAMQEAVAYLPGIHDFTAFCAAGSPVKTKVREIYEARFSLETHPLFPGRLLKFSVTGSGFLKQMVRGIVGTAVAVGQGRKEPAVFDRALRTLDRSLLGATAPAHGLWLEKVWYPERFGIAETTQVI